MANVLQILLNIVYPYISPIKASVSFAAACSASFLENPLPLP